MRSLRRLVVLAAVACAIVLVHGPALRTAAAFMTVRDSLAPAALLLPLGDPQVAASLFAGGYADEVAIWKGPPSRVAELGLVPPAHELARSALEAAGIPRDRIVLLDGTLVDTEALGRAAGAYVTEREGAGAPQRIIAVASAPWSRLTRRDLRRGLAGTGVQVIVQPTPDVTFDQANWWKTERGLITYVDAYSLWILRWVVR
jgi:hypothetical protein